jgi:segregation and condensation protein A
MIDVKIDKFQGPLSLLLQIIEKEELDITSVNLAKIADEYLEYVKKSPEILPESMADFLLLAAKLLYIKSRALLPYLLSEEEQEEVDDLEGKLRMYKDFVRLSSSIEGIIGKKKFSFFRDVSNSRKKNYLIEKSFSPPKSIKASDLKKSFEEIIKKTEQIIEEKMERKTVAIELSIDDRISYIKNAISRKIKISFTKILKNSKCRTEVVVNFLAVLELVKQREISFEQEYLFGEIFLKESSDI